MNDSPLVSIVMPAYNHELFVGEAIDSVLNQTWRALELIVIDDGSTDKTADIVKAYSDPRVHYFHQHNQDAYNALNAGLKKCKGEFIGIINSDDVFHTDRLKRLIEHMQDTGAQAIFSDVTAIDGHSQPLDDPAMGWNQWHQQNRDFYLQAPQDVTRGFLHGNLMVTTSNLLMRAEAHKKVGEFAPYRYLHDYDYIFRLLAACPDQVHYLDHEALLKYRIHGANTISEAAVIGREQDQEIIRRATLAQVPSQVQDRVKTGVERLITLEQELHSARQQLPGSKPKSDSTSELSLGDIQTKVLAKTIVQRLLAKLTGQG